MTVTRITSHKPSSLTKRYWLADGQLHKKTAANMVAGVAERVQVADAAQLADVLVQLDHNQALCFGVPEAERVQVYSRREHERQGKPAEAITRTKEAFKWPTGAGVLMLDYDPQDRPLSRSQLLDTLAEVIPELEDSARVWWPSSSSLIYQEQDQLAGIKGQRVYVLVADAADIPRAGEVLHKRLWLAGYGYYAVSRSGAALERSLIDASVWQTNRLDFAAGADCTPPLEQRRGQPEVQDGPLVDTAKALPDLSQEEEAQLAAIKDKARADIEGEASEAQQLYIEEEAAKLVERTGQEATDETMAQARATVSRAAQQGVLAGDFEVTLADKTKLTIGELLDNPSQYHGRHTLDPLEPEYNGYKQVGKLYLTGGRPNLYSHAHGGRNYRLIRQPRRVEHQAGRMTDTTHKTMEYLRQLPDVFDMGSELVQVRDGKAHRLTQYSLAFWLGGVAQYWKRAVTPKGQQYEKLLDPPAQVLNQLLAIGEGRHLKPLKAVISAPVIDVQGRTLERVGYDSSTQLYLDTVSTPPPVPGIVGMGEAQQALDTLMQPFRDFATATRLDRGVMLAAILTAIQRPILPTAPAFGLDAPVQGTGKTYLAQCLGALATGEVPTVYPHTAGQDDEETRKRLTTVLAGGERVLLWDNVLGAFDSAAMASFITSPEYSDRILGKSEAVTIPNRTLMLITGNNLTLAGDMPRRVLKCRLDAQVANPALRKFDSKPLEYIQQHRAELVQAGLTLIRGYLQSEACRAGGAVQGESTASFEEWDSLVRQPVAWIASQRPDFEDPANAIKDAMATDPEMETLAEVLEGVERVMGGEWFETKQLFSRLDTFSEFEGVERRSARHELKDTLEDLVGGKLTKRGLGRALGYRVDRIAGNRRLAKWDSKNRNRFRVESVLQEQKTA